MVPFVRRFNSNFLTSIPSFQFPSPEPTNLNEDIDSLWCNRFVSVSDILLNDIDFLISREKPMQLEGIELGSTVPGAATSAAA